MNDTAEELTPEERARIIREKYFIYDLKSVLPESKEPPRKVGELSVPETLWTDIEQAIRQAVAAERIRIQITAEKILNVPLTEVEPVERLYKAHENQNGWLARSGAGLYYQDRWPKLIEAIRARGGGK